MRCAECGAEFAAKRVNQKYCSAKCRETVKRRRWRALHNLEPQPQFEKEMRQCAECGREFKARTRVHKYCRLKCRIKANNRLYQERHPYVPRKKTWETRQCAVCGAAFEPRTYNQHYCSQECYLKGNRRNSKVRVHTAEYRLQSKFRQFGRKITIAEARRMVNGTDLH